MNKLKFVLPFPPSSNMAYPTVKRGKKLVRITSERMKEWLKFAPRLEEYPDIKTPVFVKYKMFFPDDRVRDGQSYLKPTLDYIVKQKVLEDDNRRIVKGEMWWDGGIDRENPRIEIEIKTLKEWN